MRIQIIWQLSLNDDRFVVFAPLFVIILFLVHIPKLSTGIAEVYETFKVLHARVLAVL